MTVGESIKILQARAADVDDRLRQLQAELDTLRAERSRLEQAIEILAGPVEVASSPTVRNHTGKYRRLWDWLQRQTSEPVCTTFKDIEAVLGFPLPPSSRRHAPHWYGYEGSAVARAIRDAGFRTRRVDLAAETVEFHRISRQGEGS